LADEIPLEVSLDLAGIVGKGTIPSEIGRLTRLTRLDLTGRFQITRDIFDSRKGLSGSIPTEIGKLFNLGKQTTIKLTDNAILHTSPDFE
jgi:hypothetical protein